MLLQLVHPPNLRSTYEYTIAPITLGSPQSGTRFSMKFTRSYFRYMLSQAPGKKTYIGCIVSSSSSHFLISAVLSNVQTEGHLECEEAYSKTQICFLKYLGPGKTHALHFLSSFFIFPQCSRLEQRRVEVNERRGAECDLADKLALADQRRRDMEVDKQTNKQMK